MTPFMQFLHVDGVVLWVGGMFFAYVCLRPTAVQLLEPPQRLALWNGVFARFFPAVWGAVALILFSGLSTLLKTGMAAAPLHWHLMLALGLTMTAIFAYVFFVPYRQLRARVAAADWKNAGAALNRIRQMVGLNLLLGALAIAVGTLGRSLG